MFFFLGREPLKNKRHESSWVLRAIILGLVFVILLLSASEDRAFKRWENSQSSYYRWYKDMEFYCQIKLPVNERIILDLSQMQDVFSPFQNRFTGKIRRAVYLRLSPALIEPMNLIRSMGEDIILVRVGRLREFRMINKDNYPGMIHLGSESYSQIRDIMKKHRIRYFICQFTGWFQKKNELEENGFKLKYNNIHFMLFEIPDEMD